MRCSWRKERGMWHQPGESQLLGPKTGKGTEGGTEREQHNGISLSSRKHKITEQHVCMSLGYMYQQS